MARTGKPNFTPEFRLETAPLVVDQDYSVRETAKAVNVGKSTVDKWVRQFKNVAQLMGLKERALQRRLSNENSSFQQVLDQARQQIAKEFLGYPDTNITNLAQILGYADLSTFSKAFKQWFGISPSSYKKNAYVKTLVSTVIFQ